MKVQEGRQTRSLAYLAFVTDNHTDCFLSPQDLIWEVMTRLPVNFMGLIDEEWGAIHEVFEIIPSRCAEFEGMHRIPGT